MTTEKQYEAIAIMRRTLSQKEQEVLEIKKGLKLAEEELKRQEALGQSKPPHCPASDADGLNSKGVKIDSSSDVGGLISEAAASGLSLKRWFNSLIDNEKAKRHEEYERSGRIESYGVQVILFSWGLLFIEAMACLCLGFNPSEDGAGVLKLCIFINMMLVPCLAVMMFRDEIRSMVKGEIKAKITMKKRSEQCRKGLKDALSSRIRAKVLGMKKITMS